MGVPTGSLANVHTPSCEPRARVRALDPYEDFSPLLQVPPTEDFQPGKYKRQYVEHFRSDGFGWEWNYCGSGSILRVVDGLTELRPTLCDSWSCPGCGVRKAAWFKEQLRLTVDRHGLFAFQTFTLQRVGRTPAQSYYDVAAAWNFFIHPLQKVHGKYRWVWVREPTQAGIAHVHVLSDIGMGTTNLSHRWLLASGDSYVVDNDGLGGEAGVNYLTKYCASQSKDRPRDELTGKTKLHVYGKSKSIKFERMRGNDEGKWQRLPIGYRRAEERLLQAGDVVQVKAFGAPRLTVKAPIFVADGQRYVRIGQMRLHVGSARSTAAP